jgi:hypothetical protein
VQTRKIQSAAGLSGVVGWVLGWSQNRPLERYLKKQGGLVGRGGRQSAPSALLTLDLRVTNSLLNHEGLRRARQAGRQ